MPARSASLRRVAFAAALLALSGPQYAHAASPQAAQQPAPSPGSPVTPSSSPPPSAPQGLTSPNVGPVSSRNAQAARDAYVAGAKALSEDRLDEAATAFRHAEDLDPYTVEYRIASRLVTEHRITALVQEAGRQRMLSHGAEADALLAQARTLDPNSTIVRQHDPPTEPAPFRSVLDTGPQGAPAPATTATTAFPLVEDTANPQFAGPILLKPNQTRQTFHIRGPLQAALEQVYSSFGIRAVIDDSVLPSATPQGIRFDLEDTTFSEATHILLSMGRVFATPLDSGSVVIAADTIPNRTRLEHLYQETLYTPGLSPQQMGEVTNVIRQVFDVKQLSMQNTAGNITLRAPASTLDALNRTLFDLLDGSPEVNLDLRLYSVDLTRQRNIGPRVPQQFGVYNVASAAQSVVSANQSAIDQAIAQGALTFPAGANATTRLIYEAVFLIQAGIAQSSLLTDTIGFFGKGLALTGLTAPGGAGLTLALNSSDTRALDSIQLRIADRQSATFRAGTRYPITTATYSTGLSGTNAAALAGATINGVSASSLLTQYLGANGSGTTIPQIQYEDLGITLKATPNVQASGNITLHLDLKIQALTGVALNNIPILASRQFLSDVTLAEGQTGLLLSSLSKTESVAVSGIPGLSELPGFGTVTADNLKQQNSSELVLLLTPRLARRRANITVGPRIPVRPALDASE